MTGPARCGVLGDPIRHSLSPVLHLAAYAALGLDWDYAAHRVGADELPDFVAGLDGSWRGLSLTMPLKQVAAGLCHSVDPLANRLNAVNTLVRDDRGWIGHNTDVGGTVDALRTAGVTDVAAGVVVGAGATAASALAALAELGAGQVVVLARSVARAGWLVPIGRDLGVEVVTRALVDVGGRSSPGGDVGRADLLVSTIPASAQPAYVDALVGLADVVFDVVYELPETPLLRAATARAARVISGLELLLHQAARQVVLMTGVDQAPLAAMRAALP